MFPVLKHS